MASDFSLNKITQDNLAVIKINGFLDAHTAPAFEKAIISEIELKQFRIIVNFENLSYISSAGLGVFMSLIDEVREQGGDIKLCCISEEVKEILEVVNFLEIFDVSDDLPAAIKSFQSSSTRKD